MTVQVRRVAHGAAREAKRLARRAARAGALDRLARAGANDLGTDDWIGGAAELALREEMALEALAASKAAHAERVRQQARAVRGRDAAVLQEARRKRATTAEGVLIDGPTAEREIKGEFGLGIVKEGMRHQHVTMDCSSTVIQRLAKSGKIDADQVKAADSYYRDWWGAGEQRGQSAFARDRVSGGGPVPVSEARAAAIVRLEHARRKVRAVHRSAERIVDMMVIDGATASEVAIAVGGRSNKTADGRCLGIFEAAMHSLARHYGHTRD